MKDRNQQSFLQVPLSSIIAQKRKKIKPYIAHWNTEQQRYKIIQIKIYNSKISSNLYLPLYLVFVVLFPRMDFCVGDIKHIKTTAASLIRTRWALFRILSLSQLRKFFILTAISKPCPPFTAVCEDTSTVTPDFFSGIF